MNHKAPAANRKLFNMNVATFLITIASNYITNNVFTDYKAYVLADLGEVEADTCTINAINSL